MTQSGRSAAKSSIEPGLWLVATPIGNLEDMAPRGLAVLAAADLILAEDTRVARRLLSAFGLSGRVIRCDEAQTAAGYAAATPVMEAGGVVAFVADAGSPTISDPGSRLANLAISNGHPVRAVPGASALLAALAVSGFNASRFSFSGFPPTKPGARQVFYGDIHRPGDLVVVFETVPRLHASLTDAKHVFGDVPACIARELTKRHEEVLRGRISALIEDIERRDEPLRGELVVVYDLSGLPAATDSRWTDHQLALVLQAGLAHGSVKQTAAMAAALTGLSRKQLYGMALALKERGDG